MKLPRTSNGKKYAKHPLVVLCEQMGTSAIARKLGLKHSSVGVYYRRAQVNRETLVPATWALPLAKMLDDHPGVLRPDLYKMTWSKDVLV